MPTGSGGGAGSGTHSRGGTLTFVLTLVVMHKWIIIAAATLLAAVGAPTAAGRAREEHDG